MGLHSQELNPLESKLRRSKTNVLAAHIPKPRLKSEHNIKILFNGRLYLVPNGKKNVFNSRFNNYVFLVCDFAT